MRLIVGRPSYALLNMAASTKMAPSATLSAGHGINRFEIPHSEEFTAKKTQRNRGLVRKLTTTHG